MKPTPPRDRAERISFMKTFISLQFWSILLECQRSSFDSLTFRSRFRKFVDFMKENTQLGKGRDVPPPRDSAKIISFVMKPILLGFYGILLG